MEIREITFKDAPLFKEFKQHFAERLRKADGELVSDEGKMLIKLLAANAVTDGMVQWLKEHDPRAEHHLLKSRDVDIREITFKGGPLFNEFKKQFAERLKSGNDEVISDEGKMLIKLLVANAVTDRMVEWLKEHDPKGEHHLLRSGSKSR
jgi:hypothetical protein